MLAYVSWVRAVSSDEKKKTKTAEQLRYLDVFGKLVGSLFAGRSYVYVLYCREYMHVPRLSARNGSRSVYCN